MRTVMALVLAALLVFFYLGASSSKSVNFLPTKKYEPLRTEPIPAIPERENKTQILEEPKSYTVIIEEEDESPEDEQTSFNSIEEEIAEVFGGEVRLALAIAKAESGLNPEAVNVNSNGTKDIGLFQINDRHGWSEEERFDWRANIQMAKELRDRYGWTEWSVYNNNSYRRFL